MVIEMVIKSRGNAHYRLINLVNRHACIRRNERVVSEIESLRSECKITCEGLGFGLVMVVP